jgi:putative nucleotidyltransferase with HDIG domain
MNERDIREFFQSVRRAARQVTLYPPGHPLTDEALRGLEKTTEDLIGGTGEAVVSIIDDAFYLNRSLLPHASLEYNGLMRDMQGRGVESVTLIGPVSPADLADLATFISGISDDLPADGTVRLNERPLSRKDLDDSEMSGLRRSYTASLDVMRSVANAAESGNEFELGGVSWAVEGIMEASLGQAGASLLLATVKSHDEYTFYHSVNVAILAIAIGRIVGIDEELLRPIGAGALLHDIGKINISAEVLHYPGRLSPEQWETIKLHPQEGAQSIMASSGEGQEIPAMIAFEHHMRVDGTGYPSLSRQASPHLFTRLVTVADTYDAITSRRSYRRADTPSRALGILLEGAGSAFDPDIVRAFISMMGLYPPGSILQLRAGELVMVTHHHDGEPTRPAGVIVKDAWGAAVDPVPHPIDPEAIVEHVLPARAGIDPAALLEQVGVETSLPV